VRSRSLAAAPVRNVRGFALAASAQPRNVREIDSDGAAPARTHTESASATLARRRRSTTIVPYGASHRRSEANQLFAHASRSQNRAFPSPALARRPRSVAEPVHAPFPASRSALSRLKPPQAAPSDAEALASPAMPLLAMKSLQPPSGKTLANTPSPGDSRSYSPRAWHTARDTSSSEVPEASPQGGKNLET